MQAMYHMWFYLPEPWFSFVPDCQFGHPLHLHRQEKWFGCGGNRNTGNSGRVGRGEGWHFCDSCCIAQRRLPPTEYSGWYGYVCLLWRYHSVEGLTSIQWYMCWEILHKLIYRHDQDNARYIYVQIHMLNYSYVYITWVLHK